MMNKTLLALSAFMLGTATIILPVHANNSMAGMDMGGKPVAQKPAVAPAPVTKSLSVSATLKPAAPQTGDNTLDLMVTDATGKPVTGLKLTTSVAMTSMDMGTTHPAFTEIGGGHYTAKVSFGMDGPWRVIVRNQDSKFAVLDFNAGSKTPWKSPQIKTKGVMSTQPTAPVVNSMLGMDMSGGKPADKKVDDKSAPPSGNMAGMDLSGATVKPAEQTTSNTPGMAGMDMSDTKPMKMTGIADMKTATIPELKETGTYTATGNENWKMQTGFGHNAPMVAMMNQMMVGGSGGEGMKMAPMTMKFGKQNFAKPDASDGMAGMDMGGKPADKTASQDNSMAGMKMDAPAVSAPVTITAATTFAPKAGDNPLTLSVTDAQGKPVTRAVINASVVMVTMDMGTTHPAFKDMGDGKYEATVNFGMAGSWRMLVKVAAPGQNPQMKSFDFNAK